MVGDVEAQPSGRSKEDIEASSSSDKKDFAEIGLEELAQQAFTRGVSMVERDMKQYFDHLDTKLFLRRLVRSIVPATKYEDVLARPDLYGPLLLSFALTSCLHFSFKKADPAPLDRHLATSLLLCFGSLVVGALLLDVAWQYSAAMAKQSPAKFGLDAAFCLTGYSFLGPCVVILLYGRVWSFVFIPVSLMAELGSAMSFGTAASRASYAQSTLLGAACAVIHTIWLYNLVGVLNTFDAVIG